MNKLKRFFKLKRFRKDTLRVLQGRNWILAMDNPQFSNVKIIAIGYVKNKYFILSDCAFN